VLNLSRNHIYGWDVFNLCRKLCAKVALAELRLEHMGVSSTDGPALQASLRAAGSDAHVFT
jgi:hypothetical protein